MVFHWTLSASKSPQVSRTLLGIPAVLNNAVVWMVSTRPPTSKSSSPYHSPILTVPNAPITIGMIVTFMFHSSFNSLARSRYLSFFSLSLSFILWSPGTARSTILRVFFLFFFFFFVCQSPIEVCECHSLGQLLSCAHTICSYGQIKFLAHLLVDHLAHPVVSRLILLLC